MFTMLHCLGGLMPLSLAGTYVKVQTKVRKVNHPIHTIAVEDQVMELP